LTPYEIARIIAEPFLPVLGSTARRGIKRLTDSTGAKDILDVGGRRSPYTVGLRASVTVLDLPRKSESQKCLELGLTDDILAGLRSRRSNVVRVILEDMTRCTLPSEGFDGVVSVEVIEHVPDDEAFVRQIHRVLRPGGWLYLTTPNGDYIKNEPPNYNPDHLRHYRRAELVSLLGKYFSSVSVVWAIKTGKHRVRGLWGMSPSKPIRAISAMVNNVISHLESRGLDEQPRRTAHLIAVARR
jgi:SAM-dependent methyltransferase